jgi:hypothetical protein
MSAKASAGGIINDVFRDILGVLSRFGNALVPIVKGISVILNGQSQFVSLKATIEMTSFTPFISCMYDAAIKDVSEWLYKYIVHNETRIIVKNVSRTKISEEYD